MADPMSLREYARRRGVSAKSVVRAIQSGRLLAAVVHTDQGPKIGDADVADREWSSNTDHTRAPTYVKAREAARTLSAELIDHPTPDAASVQPQAAPTLSLVDASALAMEWKAKLAELEYRKRSRTLIDASVIEARLVETFTRCRTKLLGLPSKLKAARPALTREDLMHVDRLIREALEDLAESPDGA